MRRLWQSPVLVNSFAHFLRMLGGPVSVIFIAKRLSLESQGIYYSILNLVVFQAWAEAGLTPLLINFSSHESGQLHWDSSGLAQAPSHNLRRLSQLTRIAFYYFALASPVLALVLTGMGMVAFGRLDTAQRLVVGPVWAAVTPAICLRFTMTGLWAILEGCGRMVWVYRVRLADTVVSLLTLWLGLYFGLGIYALPLSFWAGFCVQLVAMLWVRTSIRQLFSYSPTGIDGSLVREIWPLQWRIALASMSGIVGSQFSALMLYFRGAREAGQLGMTWSLLAGGAALCGIWIAARNPQQCMLLSRGESDRAWAHYRRTLVGVIALSCAIVTAGTLVVWYIKGFQPKWADRLLDVPSAGILGAGLVINWVTMAQCSWVRAHKQEPFLLVSILTAAAILIGIACLTPGYGAYGLALAYAGAVGFIALPGTTYFSESVVAQASPTLPGSERRDDLTVENGEATPNRPEQPGLQGMNNV